MKNVYTILQQIYSGNGAPNFIGIVRGLWDYKKKRFRPFPFFLRYLLKTYHLTTSV